MKSDQSQRLARLRGVMQREGVDLVVLAPGAHFAWLLDIQPHADERACFAMISQDREAFLIPALEADSTRAQTDIAFYPWLDADGPEAALRALIADFGASTFSGLVLDECMRADHAALIMDALPGLTRQFTASTIGALRMRKEDAEYAILKTNASQADRALLAAWDIMRPGMTEIEVAQVVRETFTEMGAQPLFSIVGAGQNGAFPHHHTGQTKLQSGDAVVMDVGASFEGYSSDITRMVLLGDGPEGYRDIHSIVDDAVKAALAAARPGVKACEVDEAARSVITKAGYGEFFFHRTGHGLGTEVHEPPYISASSQTVLDEGMVFSIEPGIYLPGQFGLRLEEIVILRAGGPEILSDLPRDVRRI